MVLDMLDSFPVFESIYGNHDGYRADPILNTMIPARAKSKPWISTPGIWAEHAHRWDAFNMDGCAMGAAVTNLTYYFFKNLCSMEAGKKAPNRPPVLLAAHAAASAALRERVGRIVLAGKSMGGRMGSHLAAGSEEVAGVVFYGYPLVGVGKQEPRDTSHLRDVGAPMLFVQGTRDRLAPLELITAVAESLPKTSLHIVEDGDHSYNVPKRAGRDRTEVLDEVVAVTAVWLEAL